MHFFYQLCIMVVQPKIGGSAMYKIPTLQNRDVVKKDCDFFHVEREYAKKKQAIQLQQARRRVAFKNKHFTD